ncbi:uncharacterized protein M6B38_163025 [Iris pallida]|uniref:Uncharacterized protein n=1 Tax=Iris pallida TaxID=29817 RepID=A0AAX6F1G0_IRIPA|nr:uncharacterized protein M6B38_163025 [Iris pallida]
MDIPLDVISKLKNSFLKDGQERLRVRRHDRVRVAMPDAGDRSPTGRRAHPQLPRERPPGAAQGAARGRGLLRKLRLPHRGRGDQRRDRGRAALRRVRRIGSAKESRRANSQNG